MMMMMIMRIFDFFLGCWIVDGVGWGVCPGFPGVVVGVEGVDVATGIVPAGIF